MDETRNNAQIISPGGPAFCLAKAQKGVGGGGILHNI